MCSEQLTGLLAERVMGWSVGPDRFMTGNRAWMPRWRFTPLTNLEDTFALLDASGCAYTLSANTKGSFEAEVRVSGCVGKVSGVPKARTITIALARALGLDLSDEGTEPAPVPQRRRKLRPRREVDG